MFYPSNYFIFFFTLMFYFSYMCFLCKGVVASYLLYFNSKNHKTRWFRELDYNNFNSSLVHTVLSVYKYVNINVFTYSICM